MNQVQGRKDKIVTVLTRGVEFLFKKNGITWIKGSARLAGPGTVGVTGDETQTVSLPLGCHRDRHFSVTAQARPSATARATLLTPYGLDVAELRDVFGRIMTHQVDYADLYFQYTRAEGWCLEEGQVTSGSFNIDQGVGVRAVSGDKTAFAYSDDISLPALSAAADATRAIARPTPAAPAIACAPARPPNQSSPS